MIYIIVPTFARIEETTRFLASIEKSINKDYLILLIDDHPENVTLSTLKNYNNSVKVYPSKKELWWVGSVNLGIKFLFDEYHLNDEDIVVFANNDVQIDKNCFKILEEEIKENPNQIVHHRTFNQDDVETSSGAKILATVIIATVEEPCAVRMSVVRKKAIISVPSVAVSPPEPATTSLMPL